MTITDRPKRTVKPPARFLDEDSRSLKGGTKQTTKQNVKLKKNKTATKSKFDLNRLNNIDLHSVDETADGNAILFSRPIDHDGVELSIQGSDFSDEEGTGTGANEQKHKF